MAKTTNCTLCGKELTKGFFNGNDMSLEVGSAIFVTCCEDCYEKYKKDVKSRRKRFATKLTNYKKTTKKKPSEKEIAQMYLRYLEEEEKQMAKSGNEIADMFYGFFCFNSNGYFSVREYSKEWQKQDITARDMVKSLDRAKDPDCLCFDKNDITKIEYAKVGSGTFLGLFRQAFSYAIRLNDETVMTYKPCVTRTAVLGGGFAIGYRRSAEKKLLKELNEFKSTIGSDIPIVKVKKI